MDVYQVYHAVILDSLYRELMNEPIFGRKSFFIILQEEDVVNS